MSDPRAAPTAGADGRGFFLPDFCEARAVLAIVLIAALLAIVLALARQTVHGAFWIDLARTSAYLLWTGLACAAVLCKARPWLAGKPLRTAILESGATPESDPHLKYARQAVDHAFTFPAFFQISRINLCRRSAS